MVRYKRFFESEGLKISRIDTAQFDEIKEMFDEKMNIYSIDNKDSYYLSFSKSLSQENIVSVFEALEDLGFNYFKELTETEKKDLGILGKTIVEVLPN